MRAAAPPGHAHQVERLIAPDSVLAEAVEAAIGACFLEYGFERTAEAVAEAFEPQIEVAIANLFDFKSELQERLAQRGEIVDLHRRRARRGRRTTAASRRSPRSRAAARRRQRPQQEGVRAGGRARGARSARRKVSRRRNR